MFLTFLFDDGFVLVQECCSMDEAAPSFNFVWEHAVKAPLPGEQHMPDSVTDWGFRKKLRQVLAG
jgi:hypothetical protein